MAVLSPQPASPAAELVRLAVGHVAAAPQEEQRYLELHFALDRAVERNLRYRELLTLFEDGTGSAPPADAWAWKLATALTANQMGDSPAAVRCLERAREELQQTGRGSTAAAAFVMGELARAHYHAGDHDPGFAATNHALQLARAANSSLAAAYAHHYMGLLSLRRRDHNYARRHLSAARALFEQMNQRHGRARVQDSLAILEMEQGQFDAARALLEESLAVKEDLRDLRGQALTCGNLARLHGALGDYPQALHFLNRERELTARVGDERNATQVCIQLGALHLRHQKLEAAQEELLVARSLAQMRRDSRSEAFACFVLAQTERELGNREAALEAISFARAYFDHADDALMRERTALRQAILQEARGDAPELQGPVDRLRALHAPSALAEALVEVGAYLCVCERSRMATEMYAEALDVAEPAQADQLAAILRDRALSEEGREWVDAMLTVKRQKDRLERAYDELQRAEALRDSLTQMIVHDLKNPLAAITPWLQTIQMGILDPDETQQYLQAAIDECDSLLRIIEDLNDVGKMQLQGALELARDPVALGELLADVARRLQTRARDSGMSIRLIENPTLPPVRGDRNKLRRVLENLVANAIKYGRPPEGSNRPPEILLTLCLEPPASREDPRSSIRVEVRDPGEGIPVSEADRVFEPYYQAEAGRKRKAGVGLGLAFSRMVVEAHGGAIWTQPNPDGGSIFAFRLPLPEDAAA